MPFSTIDDLVAYIDANIKANGLEEITGPIHNTVENGLVQYIKKAAKNYFKAAIVSSGGAVTLSANVTIITTATPSSLTWGDNFLNEWTIVNMTANAIPLLGGLVYYAPTGNAVSNIAANSAITIYKATNDLWVSNGGGGGIQKQPKTFIVGTTTDAPTAGLNTWALDDFKNSWVVLILSRSIIIDMTDVGDGSAYITKAINSDTLTINNYTWNTDDILTYILITP